MSYIDAHRSHRRLVSQPSANRVREIGNNVAETDVGINVSKVIKHRPAKRAADKRRRNSQRKTQFGIQDHQLLAAHWHRDFFAATWIVCGTDQDIALRPCAIQAEATQRAAAAGKKALADRNVAPA